MTTITRLFIVLGGINGALAVALGAFGAHGLKGRLTPEFLTTWQTAVQYHFYHIAGFFAVAFLAFLMPESNLVKWSGCAMVFGTMVFSGSLYILCLTGVRWLGAITPIGGAALIIAWALLALAAITH